MKQCTAKKMENSRFTLNLQKFTVSPSKRMHQYINRKESSQFSFIHINSLCLLSWRRLCSGLPSSRLYCSADHTRLSPTEPAVVVFRGAAGAVSSMWRTGDKNRRTTAGHRPPDQAPQPSPFFAPSGSRLARRPAHLAPKLRFLGISPVRAVSRGNGQCRSLRFAAVIPPMRRGKWRDKFDMLCVRS